MKNSDGATSLALKILSMAARVMCLSSRASGVSNSMSLPPWSWMPCTRLVRSPSPQNWRPSIRVLPTQKKSWIWTQTSFKGSLSTWWVGVSTRSSGPSLPFVRSTCARVLWCLRAPITWSWQRLAASTFSSWILQACLTQNHLTPNLMRERKGIPRPRIRFMRTLFERKWGSELNIIKLEVPV